jgi:hypothetical protein
LYQLSKEFLIRKPVEDCTYFPRNNLLLSRYKLSSCTSPPRSYSLVRRSLGAIKSLLEDEHNLECLFYSDKDNTENGKEKI